MTTLPKIDAVADELTGIGRDLHADPEIGFVKVRNSGIAAEKPTSWGSEVHRGIGRTGVDGLLPVGASLPARLVETRLAA